MPTPREDSAGTRFLRAAARKAGKTYHEFCKAAGIIDDAAERRLRRHEIIVGDVSDPRKLQHEIEQRTEYPEAGVVSLPKGSGSVITGRKMTRRPVHPSDDSRVQGWGDEQ